MWPWGHLAVGYVLYSLGRRRGEELPEFPQVVLLAIGTQFPDLVDKPLSWELGVLGSGRSLGHSVLIAAVVIAFLFAFIAPRVDRANVIAFVVGYLSHPLADTPYQDLLAGELATSAYFVWPLRTTPPDELELSIIEYLLAFEPGPFDYFQFLLVVVAAVLWLRDGAPGWREFSMWVGLRSASESS